MRNIEMSYYNVYYYCNIIDNLLRLFTTSIDWASTGAQFLDTFFEDNIEDFPKYSALHAFCEYAIRTLISEEDEKELTDIQARYDDDNAVLLEGNKRLKYAFKSEYGLKSENKVKVDVKGSQNITSKNEMFIPKHILEKHEQQDPK